jgi:uncharacterized protein
MSEYFSNTEKRKEQIKDLLKQIHSGTPVEALKEDFAAILDQTNAAEITEVEQMLIEEGLPAEEIQNLCDVHVLLFKENLDQSVTPETTPGHPVRNFILENKAVHSRLEAMFTLINPMDQSAAPQKLQVLNQLVQTISTFELHYARKENVLFPYLEKKKFSGPSAVMWSIHDQIRALWKQVLQLLNSKDGQNFQEIKQLCLQFSEQMQELIYKEEKILFPAAIERLSAAEWLDIAQQEKEIGYCFIQPEGLSASPSLGQKANPATNKEITRETAGQLPLDTGALTLKQINLMIRALPVDITFVDENDEVRFFSLTKDRIFQRSPAIIGRKVQNCHPPQSVDKVQKIVDDFKKGSREQAEFWIQMGEKYVVITYFALRDETGVYQGTLEVSMDAAHLRGLQGERRLLDD